ncbi:MAG: hypothetical protein H7A51_13930 [Akkermansiaceae bacterium]|nr:hypothetical protein [Akkermansiaceae bacterium]
MSWDISVYASSKAPQPVEQMPDDWTGDTLGTNREVRALISGCFPSVDWSDPFWGILRTDEYSLEFNMGRSAQVDSSDGFMIHVRGGGDAVAAMCALSVDTGWYLLDCSQSEWLHHCDDKEVGWKGFQQYRDHVASNL